MGISDVIPVPVAIDEEIEKWTIFGQPVAEVWFTTTEKIHEIIEMGPIKEYLQLGQKELGILFDAAHGVLRRGDVRLRSRAL